MRFFSVFIILLFSNVQAEKLIFSNNGEEVDITGDVVIDNQFGNITVTTADGDYLIVNDEDQPVILGFYPDDYEITAGQKIDVSWAVVNADNCEATTIPSGGSTWTGSKSAMDGMYAETNVSVTNIPATLRLTCSNSDPANTVVKQFDVELQPITDTGNPAMTFTVNSQSSFVSISSESNLASFEWSSSDVSSCTASASPAVANWSGPKSVAGSQNITITEDTIVSLTCDSLPTKSVTIDYTEGVDPSCASVQYPPLSPNKVEMSYAEGNDGFNFGESTGATLVEAFRTDQFLALSNFYISESNFRRRLSSFPAPTDQRPSYAMTYSVSECPGDFSQSAICTGVVYGTTTGAIKFSTRSSDINDSSFCSMVKDKKYYLNFVHDFDPNNNSVQPRCGFETDNACAVFTSEIDIN